MEIMPCGSWDEFKAICVTRKNLTCQYKTEHGRYELFGPEDGFMWTYTIVITDPRSAEQADFEDNHKAAFNWRVGTRSYAFATGDFEFAPKAASDVCTAGSTKSILMAMCGTKYMNGGELITDGNAAFGDWTEVHVVDHDNLLGYGVDFVLKSWIDKWFVNWKSCSDTITTPYAGLPPAGMYLKLTYHSVGATDVGFALNLLTHKAI